MRFYLNFPLVAGYVLMATAACLGMLQWAAARGGYAGLALFSADRERGARIGVGLTVGALLAYVSFAPEILTPGPAGAEVAEMFALCALVALAITLAGAAYRVEKERETEAHFGQGEALTLGDLRATLYRPTTTPPGRAPAVVLLPDPTDFIVTPPTLIEALNQAGLAVLALDAQGMAQSDAPLSRRTLLIHTSTALVQLAHRDEIDEERVGLLGVGLGGDAVWQAAASAQVRAVFAVLPMTPDAGAIAPGLHWLCELSYLQAWRWRRRWPALQRAAADLSAVELTRDDVDAAVLQASDDILTMRKDQRGVERLSVPGRRHFTLLADTQARQLVADWFKNKLVNDVA